MSTTNLELITCDLCKRHYNINVYNRHRNENQCIKRNHHRLPFESIKQRSVQIGDKIFSVQSQKQDNIQIKTNQEKKQQLILSTNNNHKQQQHQDKLQRILPSNNRRRILEQAKQLLERRTKYQPPWIQKRLKPISTIDSFQKFVDQGTRKFHSNERSILPTTKFKNDDLPIKSTHSPPKIRASQAISTSKTHQSRVNQIVSHEQPNSASRPIRKANTWTRSSKQSINRDAISPIQIPTFCESSSNTVHDRIVVPFNQNYDGDDDDEFERYSPTPPPPLISPKYIKQNFILDEQQTMIRPNTYQKAKRFNRQSHEILIQPRRKNIQSTFHLPPINNPPPYSKLHPRPWR